MKLSKKLVGSLCAGLALVIVASATYAWFTSKDSVENKFETATIDDGSVKIVEHFDPPPKWEPNQEIAKEVTVANNGEIPVFVRVSYEEILDKLNTPAKPYDKDTQPSGAIPAVFNTGAYTSWDNVDLHFKDDNLKGLPSGHNLTIKVKKDVDSTTTKAKYTFVIFTNETPAQRVTADFSVDKETGKILTVSNIKYWYFDGRLPIIKAAWSILNDNTGADRLSPIPTTPNNSGIEPLIEFKHSNMSATPEAGKWWYNAKDGFFYYIGKLDPGTSTPEMLSSVKLNGDGADNTLAGMKYQLFVNMRALQLDKAALTSDTGWKLDPVADKTLIDKLIEAAGLPANPVTP